MISSLTTVISYLSYLFRAKGRHSLHSPFVYQLMDHVIRGDSMKPEYETAEKIRRQMLRNSTSIVVKDWGTGGRIQKDYSRPVKSIAGDSAIRPATGRLIHRLAAWRQPRCILELGTSLGIGTLYLQTACKNAELHTLEGSPAIANLALENFRKAGFDQIHVHTGPFSNTLEPLLKTGIQPGLVYVDGDHEYEPTLQYFQTLLQYADHDMVIVFDDIHWSRGMEKAWRKIIRHPRVKISLDLYQQGWVFLQPGPFPQRYTLRCSASLPWNL